MDVLYFLKERTTFIRYLYDGASSPFLEIQRQIDTGSAPFDNPPSEELPPFEIEWQKADAALQTIGRTCISLLSASLQLYFMTWEKELQISCKSREYKMIFKTGIINGYRKCFSDALNFDWSDCPVDLDIIEQVTLTRNRDQHPDDIVFLTVTHSPSDRKKYPLPYFMSDTERAMFSDPQIASTSWLSPTVHVSRDALFRAIEQVEMFGKWLEPKMLEAKFPRRI